MAFLHLRSGVHATPVGDDLVLLDVGRDAYVCLPGAAGPWSAGQSDPHDPQARALAEALAAGGLLAMQGPAPRRPAPRLARPAAGLAPEPSSDVRPTDLLRLLRAWLDFQRHYRGRPFAHLLAAATDGRPAAPADAAERARLARVFHRLAVWLPLPAKCLARSFVLLRFLHLSGATAEWRFGVALWPFRAHCWLEADGVVLDDAPERLAPYTPILAV
ncbi:MAG: lasso peptide biosynthesis B2 protein [Pseudomonadota bacterium]